MKRTILLFLLSLFFVACSHGRTQHFPQKGNDDTHALVNIVRSTSTGGCYETKVVLDGWVINYLSSGEYIKFHVESGVHSTCLQETPITIAFEKGRKYYFLIDVHSASYFSLDYIVFGKRSCACEQIKQEKYEEIIKSKWLNNSELWINEYKEQDPNLKETQ